jgi:site-specific recombinase XerC
MLEIPDRSTIKGIRDYAILRLLWDNALRRNEICSLDVGDFDITAYLDASDGNIRAAQGLSRHASLNTLNHYDDNRHKFQAIATNTLADLV